MYLLDTHSFVWLVSDHARLPRKVKEAISDADEVCLSSISALEIALLVKRERLTLPVESAAFIQEALEQHDVEEISVDWRVAHRSALLPDIHNDPFDRLIIATAQIHHLTIITRDEIMPTYPGIRTLWE